MLHPRWPGGNDKNADSLFASCFCVCFLLLLVLRRGCVGVWGWGCAWWWRREKGHGNQEMHLEMC